MSRRDILTSYARGERLTHSVYGSGGRGALEFRTAITGSRHCGTATGVLRGGVIRSGTTA